MTKRLMFGLAVAAMCVVGRPEAVRAETITFANVPEFFFGPGTPTVEGSFRYDAFSGGLFGEPSAFGNPPPEVEGAVATEGGVLTVVRNDVPGGLFTFDAADIVSHFREDQPVTFAGFLGGILQATDVFNTGASNVYVAVVSSILAGVEIDELRVTLNASSDNPSGEALDNLGLTPQNVVPEPATLSLLGLGLAGIGVRRWRGRKAH
jgi:hypothetical protein